MIRSTPRGAESKVLLGYLAMLAATVAIYELVREVGTKLLAPTPLTGAPLFGAALGPAHVDALPHVLLALVVVIITARAVGMLFKRFAQPAVVGEILAGILLGPSLLGRVAPHVSAYLLPATVAPFLHVLSQVGVILYMFLVGLELDPSLLRKRGRATIAISHASIILPFTLGAILALSIYPRLSTQDVPFTCFSLFMGVSMSVTAFPVLARILTDRKIHRTRVGVITLTCAAVDDVTAWCLLAFVVSVVQARVAGALLTFGFAVAYIALMLLVARPLMVRLSRVYGNRGRLTQGVMALVFVGLLTSSLLTDLIGVHAVFGAFLLGAIIPHDGGLARELTDRLEDLVVVLLLPAFFAFTGMRTQIGLVSGTEQWLLCGAIIVVASIGKFGGSMLAARLTGLGWRDASVLGVLMNTRGLMELIVLNIGLELRVITPTLFAMLVLMALVTTFATTPILHAITRGRALEQAEVPAPPTSATRGQLQPRGDGLLVPVSNPNALRPLLDLALTAARPSDPPPRVLALVRRPPGGIRTGLREREGGPPPAAPILNAALQQAAQRGVPIIAEATWTDDPAEDILAAARDPRIGWLLLGFHRAVFGGDLLGGVVKDVLARLGRDGVHVGVVVHGSDRKLNKVVVVVDDSDDGRAALEMGARIARVVGSALHAVLVADQNGAPSPALEALLRDAARDAGRWLYTDVLKARDPAGLAYKTVGDLVIMGVALAEELGLPLDEPEKAHERCLVLVRGGAPRVVQSGEGGAQKAS